MKSFVILMCFVFPSLFSYGQSVLDGDRSKRFSSVREADIMWMKRIWRRVDLRQKANQHLYFPEVPVNGRVSLFDNLKMAIMEGSVVAYNPGALGDDDMFTTAFSRVQLDSILNPSEMVSIVDPFSLEDKLVEIENPISSRDVIMYEIKEDWFFDKQRSIMEVRIVGICPLQIIRDESTGEFKGYKRLFWIDMSKSSTLMDNWLAFNRANDAEQRSFEEVFRKRMFSSIIVKESNVYNRSIAEYAIGEEALFESIRIEQELLIKEHDLWSY